MVATTATISKADYYDRPRFSYRLDELSSSTNLNASSGKASPTPAPTVQEPEVDDDFGSFVHGRHRKLQQQHHKLLQQQSKESFVSSNPPFSWNLDDFCETTNGKNTENEEDQRDPTPEERRGSYTPADKRKKPWSSGRKGGESNSRDLVDVSNNGDIGLPRTNLWPHPKSHAGSAGFRGHQNEDFDEHPDPPLDMDESTTSNADSLLQDDDKGTQDDMTRNDDTSNDDTREASVVMRPHGQSPSEASSIDTSHHSVPSTSSSSSFDDGGNQDDVELHDSANDDGDEEDDETLSNYGSGVLSDDSSHSHTLNTLSMRRNEHARAMALVLENALSKEQSSSTSRTSSEKDVPADDAATPMESAKSQGSKKDPNLEMQYDNEAASTGVAIRIIDQQLANKDIKPHEASRGMNSQESLHREGKKTSGMLRRVGKGVKKSTRSLISGFREKVIGKAAKGLKSMMLATTACVRRSRQKDAQPESPPQQDVPNDVEAETNEKRHLIDVDFADQLINAPAEEPSIVRASKYVIKGRELLDEAAAKKVTDPAEGKALTRKAHTYAYVARQLAKEALLKRQARINAGRKLKEDEEAKAAQDAPDTKCDTSTDSITVKVEDGRPAAAEKNENQECWLHDLRIFNFEDLIPSCFSTCTNPPVKEPLEVDRALDMLASLSEGDPKETSTHSKIKSTHSKEGLAHWKGNIPKSLLSREKGSEGGDRAETEDSKDQQMESDNATKASSKTGESIGSKSSSSTLMYELVENLRTFYNTDIALSLSTGFSNDKADEHDDDDDDDDSDEESIPETPTETANQRSSAFNWGSIFGVVNGSDDKGDDTDKNDDTDDDENQTKDTSQHEISDNASYAYSESLDGDASFSTYTRGTRDDETDREDEEVEIIGQAPGESQTTLQKETQAATDIEKKKSLRWRFKRSQASKKKT